MKDLAKISTVKEILKENGFHFSKSLGQNFLIDENVLSKIIEGSNVSKDTNVIEIGPGFGVLTQRLIKYAKKVVSIEIDSSLIPILEDNFKDCDNFKLINQDVLKCDLNKIIQEEFNGEKTIIVANLPYYITTPILMHILEGKVNVESVTVMIQKEVCQRLKAKEGSKDYGAITLSVNYYSTPTLVTIVKPSSFIPAPKVDSAVIRLDIKKEPPVKLTNEKGFFSCIKASFMQRRKTLLNALSSSPLVPKGKDEISAILNKVGIDEKRRGETLSMEEFAVISNEIFK